MSVAQTCEIRASVDLAKDAPSPRPPGPQNNSPNRNSSNFFDASRANYTRSVEKCHLSASPDYLFERFDILVGRAGERLEVSNRRLSSRQKMAFLLRVIDLKTPFAGGRSSPFHGDNPPPCRDSPAGGRPRRQLPSCLPNLDNFLIVFQIVRVAAVRFDLCQPISPIFRKIFRQFFLIQQFARG